MRKTSLILLILALFMPLFTKAENTINLTPLPKQISMKQGTLTLPENFAISTNGLSEEMIDEVKKFAKAITTVREGNINIGNDIQDALITVSLYSGSTNIGDEGYKLDITTTGITLSANTAQGLYYGFQTIKKILPPCVMAQVKDSNVNEYTLPCLSIVDAPRFEYRGFMLDVARHYFEVEEIKRMLDVMSYYKMNRFHWHLVDDQGWRIQIDKYPKLTTIGATRSNSWSVDPIYGGYYTNEPYGPYFYTKEEAREIVEYAKERHIEVIPEVEFPGHACAALAAYPEFSCTPGGSHSVKVDGGIYSD
ncbi:MAG: beta-N-acetylhexosaminidase, partial [Bacteroidaceae bacterium]|nr:beta-N-acetylhexosaminidase [Bacteroidaceae bacterium]